MKLPRQARLSGAEAFGTVFARPTVSRDAYFKVLSRANDQDINRLGMAVSRRVCAKAVGRNRLKRLIRESFRDQQVWAAGQDAGVRDFVVLPSAAAAAISNAELFRSLTQHWRRHWRRADDSDHSGLVDGDRHTQAKGN
jgi:ribonuclease P protein component